MNNNFYIKVILAITTILILIGTVFISSVSIVFYNIRGLDIYSGVKLHFLAMAVALFLSFTTYYLMNYLKNKEIIYKSFCHICIIVFVIVLLCLPLTPWGFSLNGASRSIRIFKFTLIPSEIIKPMLIVAFACLYEIWEVNDKKIVEIFFIVTFLVCSLIFIEPSKTSALQVAILCYFMFSFSNISNKWKFGFLGIGLAGFLGMIVHLIKKADYSSARISSFLNTPSTQTKASLNSIQFGGFFGRGVGEGLQKYGYLSEGHTDYIFSSIAEEGGFIISIIVILLLATLIYMIFILGNRLKNTAYRNICYGIGISLSLQTVMHLAINLNLMPSTGVTLPFLSYGGSSMIANFICISILMWVAKQDELGGIK